MPSKNKKPQIPLPKSWGIHVKIAILHVIALAQYALAYSRSWAADSSNERVRLKAENDRLEQELALRQEELRIKDARMAQMAPARRPHYPPTERMAILELRATRGWSLEQTARTFLVTADTIRSWVRRIDEAGAKALVQTCLPVNKFPDYVRYLVQRLKVLCPMLGKQKIAQVLCRAGLHLGTTTVGRILKEDPHPQPARKQAPSPQSTEETLQAENVPAEAAKRVVTAKRINHVWHVDLTLVPTHLGFWTSWLPFSLPQCWPFGYWVAVAIDHFSRRAMGFTVFQKNPDSRDVRSFLGRAMHQAQAKPKYLICDKGKQFWCRGFKDWCRRKGIRPRFGAVGQHGSVAVVERFIQTVKVECTRRLLVSFRAKTFRQELLWFSVWYNQHRSHTTLGCRTPDEVYFPQRPANQTPRFEPRALWLRPAPCALPQVLVKGQPGVRIELEVSYQHSRKHLPVATIRRAA
jgi:transposase InsO family protein